MPTAGAGNPVILTATMSNETHLWDVEHPFYHHPGNGLHSPIDHPNFEARQSFDSWNEFYEHATTTGLQDPELNLIYRWDWFSPDPTDLEPGESPDTLLLYIMQQRKAVNYSCEIAVTRDDEPAITTWLTERAKAVRSIWAPLLDKALNEPD